MVSPNDISSDRLDEFDRTYLRLQVPIRQHSRRVGIAAFLIAYASGFAMLETYGLSELELKESIINGGRYHDFGKKLIPSRLYRNDLKYNEEDTELLRRHPIFTEQILNEYADVIFNSNPQKQLVMDMGKYHHERYDGNGFPYKLKHDEIPVIAGICAAANDLDNEIWIRYRPKNVDASMDMLMKKNEKAYGPAVIRYYEATREWLNKMYGHKGQCNAFIENILCGRLP